MKKVLIILIALAALLMVGICTHQQTSGAEDAAVEEVHEETKAPELGLPADHSQAVTEEDLPMPSETPVQETVDSPSEEQLQEQWEDLTEQFAEMGELELPEDVF